MPFTTMSSSQKIDADCEKLISVDIHKVIYDLIGKHPI